MVSDVLLGVSEPLCKTQHHYMTNTPYACLEDTEHSQQPVGGGLGMLSALGDHHHVILTGSQAVAVDKLAGGDESEVHGGGGARLEGVWHNMVAGWEGEGEKLTFCSHSENVSIC